MESRDDLLLQLIRQASERRREGEEHFRSMILAARTAGLPLSPIADAAGLSVGRIHGILEEMQMPTYSATPRVPEEASDDVVVVAARIAYEDYLNHNAYICQDGRSFRDVDRMGFYRHGRIERHFPAIRAVEDHVWFSDEHSNRLRGTGSPIDAELAALIELAPAYYRKYEGEPHKVFLLTPPDDPRTLALDAPIVHGTDGRGSAWTMGQRYLGEAALRRRPTTTDQL